MLYLVLEFKNPNYYKDSYLTDATEVSIQVKNLVIENEFVDPGLYDFPNKLYYVGEIKTLNDGCYLGIEIATLSNKIEDFYHIPLEIKDEEVEKIDEDAVSEKLKVLGNKKKKFNNVILVIMLLAVSTIVPTEKVEGKTLIVLPEKNENVQKSARNIEGTKTSLVNTINVYDLLKYNKLVLTVDAVKSLEEVYA